MNDDIAFLQRVRRTGVSSVAGVAGAALSTMGRYNTCAHNYTPLAGPRPSRGLRAQKISVVCESDYSPDTGMWLFALLIALFVARNEVIDASVLPVEEQFLGGGKYSFCECLSLQHLSYNAVRIIQVIG